METIIVDADPFIHLNQIGQLSLLKKFSSLHTTTSVISEIKPDDTIPLGHLYRWENLKIVTIKDQQDEKIKRTIAEFRLHRGESDILYLASRQDKPIILTDDLNARTAAQSLGMKVHGTVGVIVFACHNQWISLHKAEESLRLLSTRSSLFITSAIIERAIQEIRRFEQL